ncbi:exodeoxyribonuclease V subunit alpha [Luteimicrobium xylanilyticum]|uniref:RecBCD enzyme subunit RecD n=1 Tax=Luteimicrobium xylanilyticum TaxID=1133546 RepID=A0A5P9Q6G6_9MICO|nr:exodeoxyribonuclease V subunit alpha [Luteimicrobium xylanilyticum]QFU96983.1 Exodeoxyribonuclease V [Luteimicrobium xylanilyticum]
MSAITAEIDGDPRAPWRAGVLLGEFARAGVLTSADVSTAERLGRLTGEADETVHLAAALAVRALRSGSACVDLRDVRTLVAEDVTDDAGTSSAAGFRAVDDDAPALVDLPWPDDAAWESALRRSPMVADGVGGPPDRPVRLVDHRLYLDRYWRDEQVVRAAVEERLASPLPVDEPALEAALTRYFPGGADDRQRLAAATAARSRLTVLTGGPGTGKTTTVARLVATLRDVLDGPAAQPGAGTPAPLRVAFCAPTGKAAARLQEAVDTELARLGAGSVHATTIHRLLGSRPGSRTRFRHDRTNRLPHDVVVMDEASMVSLPLLARVLEALRPDARLVLVGDRHQLASVEVGAVLGDLVDRLASPVGAARVPDTLADLDTGPDAAAAGAHPGAVVELVVRHRFGEELGALADAINAGRADDALALLRAGGTHVEFVELADDVVRETDVPQVRDDVAAAGSAVTAAAQAGDAAAALTALGTHRLLVAHRRGPAGVVRWAALAQGWVAEATGLRETGPWPVGRPVLVTTNDRTTGLSNGDTGVVLDDGEGGVVVAFGEPGSPRLVRPHRLPAVEPVHAMTVHRAQGSQFTHVSVVLPGADSPLLTRELLYTAVTRAQELVRVVGTADAVRAAVSRPVRRASGLRFAR